MKTRIIKTESVLHEYFSKVSQGAICTLDTESTSLEREALLLGLSFYTKGLEPMFATTNYFWKGLEEEQLISICRDYFSKLDLKFVMHNAKYDLEVLEERGLDCLQLHMDTTMMIHCCDPDKKKNLETRLYEDLKIKKKQFKEIIGKSWDKIDWAKDTIEWEHPKKGKISPLITAENLGEYAGGDAKGTYDLYQHYLPILTKDPVLEKVYHTIEHPLVFVLRDMHNHGICIDKKVLNEMLPKIEDELASIQNKVFSISGRSFNIGSSKQKAEVLYNHLGYPVSSYTASGQPSTDSDALEYLKEKHGCKVAEELLRYSELTKLKSTYVEAIPRFLDSDGILRCGLNSDGTRTGRMSSSRPNLQNQPNNDEFPIRQAFVPSEGSIFVIADYSQVEPRIMAHCSNDEGLIKIYKDRGDIYIGIAEDLGITRKQAKVVQLAISYGLGAPKLANSLSIKERDAQQIIDAYYFKYKKLAKWKEKVETFAKQNGFVRNIFGRLRYLPGIKSSDKRVYFSALRQAVNTTIQGSAADINKMALIKAHSRFKAELKNTHLVLSIHDEALADSWIGEAEEAAAILKHSMENVCQLRVELRADPKLCWNWADMKRDHVPSVELKPKAINFYSNFFLWQ